VGTGYDILKGQLYPVEGETPTISYTLPKLLDVGTYTPSVNDMAVKITSKSGVDLTSNYNLTIHPGTLTITARPLHLAVAPIPLTYNGLYQSSLAYSFVDGTSLASTDQTLSISSESRYWFVGTYPNTLSAKVIGVSNPSQDYTKNYAITWSNNGENTLTISPYTIHYGVRGILCDSLSKYYDGQPLSVPSGLDLGGSLDGVSYLYIEEGYALQSGDSVDFSSVQITFAPDASDQVSDATLAKQLTEKGAYSFSLSKPTFIHTDSQGAKTDVTSCYDVSFTGSMICHILPRPIDLLSSSASKVYDGTTLTSSAFTTRLTPVSLANPTSIYQSKWPTGDPFIGQQHLVVTGDPTLPSESSDVGDYANRFNNGGASFQVFNEANEERTYDYVLTLRNEGTLQITPREITVATPSGEKVYDGTPLVLTNATITSGSLAMGESIAFASTQTSYLAGTYQNTLAATILNASNNDVTKNYKITWVYGSLTIHQRPITITTPSANFTFSGAFQNAGAASVTSGSLADGDYLSGAITSVKYVGTVENRFVEGSAIISRTEASMSVDVSASYLITYVYGSLVMAPLPISVSLYNYESVYDGEATVLPSDCLYLSNGTSLPTGYKLVLSLTISTPEAGVYKYADATTNPSVKVLDSEGMEVPMENFVETYVESGSALTVKKRPLVIMTLSGSKIYDGKPFPASILKPIPVFGTLVGGQSLTIGLGGMENVTEIGSYTNTIGAITILNKENTNVADSSYDIQKIEGTLTIKGEA
jgi:hypothetical protein